ncbi:DUF4231 domain-containing protein [Streptomyces sp. NPDC002490]|uniref:DUF4231 domain-containing protein n=1 Tax=Streptomyces sp. NPDC002490 TaxID=3154416 RepID=UPI0033349BDC
MQWVWARQSVWSQAANEAKRAIGRARKLGLVLGATGACAGTAAAQVMAWNGTLGKVLAFLAAVTVGLVPVVTKAAGPQQVGDWTRLRSVSERLKGEVYAYLAHVDPYRDPDAHQVLLERVERDLTDASDLVGRTIGIAPRARSLPAVTDVDSYLAVRVVGQVEGYYRPRAAHMGQRSTHVRRVEVALAATAVLLGAVSGAFGGSSATAWVATVTTVAAAVTAHAASSRYAYQEMEFSRTATELETLIAQRAAGAGPASDDVLVARCERAISAQNDNWVTKWLSE